MAMYFLITGLSKSGNNWLTAMLFELDAIGGYSFDSQRGIPLVTEWLIESQPMVKRLSACGIPVETCVKRLLNPLGEEPISVSSPQRLSLMEAFGDILPKLKGAHSGLRSMPTTNTWEIEDIERRLFEPISVNKLAPHMAFGCPAKHLTVAEVRNWFPTFLIIQIIRDPRDTIVSRFYHDLATLSKPMVQIFTIRDPVTETLRQNPDWQRTYLGFYARQAVKYHRWNTAPRGTMHQVRYEALLADTASEVTRCCEFLGCQVPEHALTEVVDRYTFRALTGGTQERRNSFLRKGKAGDWRNYFYRGIVDLLGHEFPDLLVRLGYEPDHSWINDLPTEPPRQFEFSRFRSRRSLCHKFLSIWRDLPDLQRAFPNPFDNQSEHSFHTWLLHQHHPMIRSWRKTHQQLEQLWQVDIEDDQYF